MMAAHARRALLAAPRHRAALLTGSTRSMSILKSIFGIGEFEAPRNQPLRGTTNKNQAFDLALLEYVSMNAHPKFMLQKVLEDDNRFLMGHVLVAASQSLSPMVHQDTLDAAATVEIAQALAEEATATVNEKLHVAALDALVSGRYREAAAVYETILLNDPSDLLAQRCAFDVYLILGDYKNLLTTVTRRLPSWSPNDAGFSHLLGMQAYGLQAAGQLDAAEQLAERALSMNGNDRWALHTVLQVLEAKGNANHGASYALQHKDEFDNGGPLEPHLYFQWALYLLELGRYDRIEKFLDLYILPRDQQEHHSVRALCDATQLFWRLHFVGEDVTHLQHRLKEEWEAISVDEREGRVVFPVSAKLLRYSVLSSVSEDAANNAGDNVPDDQAVDIYEFEKHKGVQLIQFSYPRPTSQLTTVYNAVCHGFMAYSQGRYQDAVDVLLPVRGSVEVLGGTSVSQELVELLLIESATRCEDLQLAKLLLNERVSSRPQSAQAWSVYSRVFESIGDASALRDAQGMSYVLGLGQGGNKTN
ncbi:hypothetical protein Poli38472_002199 [Pythium oligandrum]|uniref:Tetratricopeptide repeat protein 38 n=1 Tax=Pythium oligandrum TaxID=41045 RepID=A0A8K1CHV2_PYTOL|nr:hypothetical protein Poli38472_002199 [Pythium oligandrum]|eukprot:TMW63258.1 hypothetical protein Poli38472_002199 [Pythium oligandrum]